jgi:hypothetical protein
LKHSLIYNSLNYNTKLILPIFSDFKARSKLSCGRTKAEAIVTNVVAPLCVTEFLETFYHSVQSLLSSRLLSRNVKVAIYKTIILRVVLCGCETWSLTLREQQRLWVFENRVLRRVFGWT